MTLEKLNTSTISDLESGMPAADWSSEGLIITIISGISLNHFRLQLLTPKIMAKLLYKGNARAN